MPQVIFTAQAISGLQRCRAFLQDKNPLAAQRAGAAIMLQISALEASPHIGRPVEGIDRRELIIPFADAGYVALYRYDGQADVVYVLAIRHQKEAGF